MKFVKIYGLKRTGTNFLQIILENNFKHTKCLVSVLGWKHGFFHENGLDVDTWELDKLSFQQALKESNIDSVIYDEVRKQYINDEINYIVISKNPFSYLYSLSNLWDCAEKIYNLNDTNEIIKSIEHYNNFFDNHINKTLIKINSLHIKYEDLLINYENSINIISSKFNLRIINYKDYSNKYKEQITKDKKNFLINKEYMDSFTDKTISFINEHISNDILTFLGYE